MTKNVIIILVIIGGIVLLYTLSERGNTKAVSKSHKRVNDGRSGFTSVSGSNERVRTLKRPPRKKPAKKRSTHSSWFGGKKTRKRTSGKARHRK